MRKCLVVLFFLFVCVPAIYSQIKYPDRLKVFINCLQGCDMDFIRTEINLVDFLLDRQAADIYVMIIHQNTGGGGHEYQLIFYGQNQFANSKDTLHFINEANNTDFENRDLLVKYLKLGLTPYIAHTKTAAQIQIQMKSPIGDSAKLNSGTVTKDPWNYWVFRTSMSGNISKDAVYKESEFNGELSANRITEEIKIGFEFDGSKSKSDFKYKDSSGNIERFTNRNNNYDFSQYIVKSINTHWSWGYEVNVSRSTFSNNKSRYKLSTGIEYNIFPYKLSNTKKFTIAYIADVRRNNYIDTTLFEKTKESLFGHGVDAKLTINQKWGTVYFSSKYHNYLNNWKYFNLSADALLDIRISGGLSVNIFTSAELIRDQIELPKAGATPQEVLTRRRQLASGYRFSTHFGLSYRFGSKLNNFVNPRFD